MFFRSILFVSVWLTLPAICCADFSPYSVRLNNSTRNALEQAEVGDSIRFTLRLINGKHEFTLRKVKRDSALKVSLDGQESTLSSSSGFFQGHRTLRSWEKSALKAPAGAAATVSADSIQLFFYTRRAKLVTIDFGSSNRGTVKRARKSMKFPCAQDAFPLSGGGYGGDSTPPTSALYSPAKMLDVAIDVDAEFYADYGAGGWLTRVQSVLNAAEAIYTSQLGVVYNLVASNAFTSAGTQPYTSTNSDTLLGQLKSYRNSNPFSGSPDVAHLFSGKNFDGNTIGLAWLGVVCDGNWKYGIVETEGIVKSYSHLAFAHELGHNFNASHHDSSSSIMEPVADSGNTSFSSFSLGEMSSYIDSNGSCMAEQGLSLSNIRVRSRQGRRKARFNTTYTISSNIDTTGCTFSLYGASKSAYLDPLNLDQAILLWSEENPAASINVAGRARQAFRATRKRAGYVRGVLDCPGTDYSTSPRRFKVYGKSKRYLRRLSNSL